MGRKSSLFFDELLEQHIHEAMNNDFGKAIMRLPNQGIGEVSDEVLLHFSARAMEQVNALATKYGITDPACLNEFYQLTRLNLVQGFRIGQSLSKNFLPS